MKKLTLIVMCLFLCVSYACRQEQVSLLKIMSYNIKHGEGMDGVLDLSRAAAIIKAQSPDLCGIQEVDQHCQRTDSIGQTAYLARETGMAGTFGAFMDFQGGEYGMASLSAKPLISTKILSLPDGIYEPRSSIIHEVEIAKACTLVFAVVHFDWIGGEEGMSSRLRQAKALVHSLDSLNMATLITGDFNCTPDSPTMRYFAEQGFEFAQKGEDRLSFQGGNKVEIDHLIYRNTANVSFRVKSIRLLNEPVVSDHRPLIAEMEVVY